MAELTDKAPVYEIGCQTEFKINRPPTPHKMPKLSGVSKKTLTEDNELFLFDDEVEPILSVLCGKTLEIARMEVLQEEELAEMKRQQESFAKMRSNDDEEIQKMEEAEQKRLEAHMAKKSLERSRREAKKIAQKKVVSRVLSKQFTKDMRVNAFTFLRDVGMFRDRFNQDVLEADVMPWLVQQTAAFVAELGSHEQYPNTLIGNYMLSAQERHKKEVEAYAERIKERRAQEQKAEEDKVAAKQNRKLARQAKRKAAEVAALREQIDEKYVKKVTPIEEILKQEITDMDGWGQADKPCVSVLGGFFGQLMIVLHTVAKYYPQLDRPVRTGRSGSNRPKSTASKKSQGGQSARSGKAESEAAESVAPRLILTPSVVQNFLYNYI